MAANETTTANETWQRYCFVRDNGHSEYIKKAKQCEDFFAGLQWSPEDMAFLRAVKRPALTINKIISTISNVLGEQIFNRSEIAYRPRNEGASNEVADALTKVFMQISDNNQLDWVRSEVFCDGIVTGRGFFDARLEFTDAAGGEVSIAQMNPKNVLIDPDADEYDPDKWGDVIVSKWMSPDMIGLLYDRGAAKELASRQDSYWPYGYDSVDRDRDRFGTQQNNPYNYGVGAENLVRNIRVIERQHRQLQMMKHFVDINTGDMRAIPPEWDRDRIARVVQQYSLGVTKKLVQRIRWTIVADGIVLHDDWSPYDHFTIVPYFPYFRRGRTIGLVENLLGPQELLNKVSSQELHVVNTTANSGWKVKKGTLQNMSIDELEQRGAQTGIVLELSELDGAEKIQPNATPQGLDRITYKAEEHIKSISGVSDSMLGFDREDVAAKAITAKQQRGTTNLAKPMDNLLRTDHILARNVLGLVQRFYTEQRLLFITKDRITGERAPLTVNEVTPEGTIVNDLTIGEYAVVVTSQPMRDTFEDSQFDQALGMFEKGIPIPPAVLVESSRLKNKAEIVKQMQGDQDSPEAQQQAQLKARADEANVTKLEAEATETQTKAQLNQAKAQKEMMGEAPGAAEAEFIAEKYKMDQEFQLEMAKLELEKQRAEAELKLKREVAMAELELKREDLTLKREAAERMEYTKQAQAMHQGEGAAKPH